MPFHRVAMRLRQKPPGERYQSGGKKARQSGSGWTERRPRENDAGVIHWKAMAHVPTIRSRDGGDWTMRFAFVLVSLGLTAAVGAQGLGDEAWRLEIRGDARQAEARLAQAANGSGATPASVRAYAEFLDRYRDPEARQVYGRLAQMLERGNGSSGERLAVNRRLIELDLIAGDRAAAAQHLQAF